MENIKLDDRVKVLGKNSNGKVAFIGEAHFSDGLWFGIILDEAKGRNNGAVDGIRYFKCERNHGLFVRASQIAKENLDNDDVHDKTTASVSTKITYPNYLKSSSKLRSSKRETFAKNAEIVHKSKSNMDKQNNDKENDEANDNNTVINEKNEEMQKIKDENEEIKTKLKNIEESLHETLQKYSKATDDINNLKDELDINKKQIRKQKCYIKLLKLTQCNHYKRAKTNCSSETNASPEIDDLNISDDEFDLEHMKAVASIQRVVELEEQKRVMIHGLIELKKFFKSCHSSLNDPEEQKDTNGKNGMSDALSLSSLLNLKLTPEESDRQLKEYTDILNKMTQFRKTVQEKSVLTNVQNSDDALLQIAEDDNHLIKEYSGGDNEIQIKDCSRNQLRADFKVKTPLEVQQSLQTGSKTSEKSLHITGDNFQNNFQTVESENQERSFMLPKKKRTFELQFKSQPSDVPNAMQELKDLISGIGMKVSSSQEKDRCLSSTSSAEQQCLMEVQDLDASSLNSNCQTKFPASLPEHPWHGSFASSYDNALNSSKNQKAKSMLFSIPISQRAKSAKSK